AARLVPDRDGEHPLELRDGLRAAIFVQMDDRLGIGLRTEPMAGGVQAAPQIPEVVDLAVVDDADGAVLVRHRLICVRGKAEHAGARKAEADARARPDVGARGTGTAMDQAIAHRDDLGRSHRPAVEAQLTADAAHAASVGAQSHPRNQYAPIAPYSCRMPRT